MYFGEEFWWETIELADYNVPPSKGYKEMRQLISRHKDRLLSTMIDAQKELFAQYADCVREYQTMAECVLFQNRFPSGAKMISEIMEADSVNHSYR